MVYWEYLDGPYKTRKEAERHIPKFMKTGKGYKRSTFKVVRESGPSLGGNLGGHGWIIVFKETRTFGILGA